MLAPSQAGATACFLRELLLTPCPFVEAVEEDFRRCIEVHFQDVGLVVPVVPGGNAVPTATLLQAVQESQQGR